MSERMGSRLLGFVWQLSMQSIYAMDISWLVMRPLQDWLKQLMAAAHSS